MDYKRLKVDLCVFFIAQKRFKIPLDKKSRYRKETEFLRLRR